MRVIERLTNRILPLARHELLLGIRGGTGLACLALCAIAGIAAGAQEGMTPSLAGYRVARLSAMMLGFLCLPLTAAAARRDAATRAADAVQSRPHEAHELLLARWLGNLGAMVVMLVALAVFTFAAQLLLSHRPPIDAGPRFSFLAIIHSLFIGALPLIFISAVGYCVVELLQNALAAAVIAVYWLLVMLGRDYLARIFDFSLTQNTLVYLLLSAGVVLAAAAVARYRQGLANARKLNTPTASAACLLAGTLLAWHLVVGRHDPPLHPDILTLTEAGQSITVGRLPGFWLPDQHGQMIRLRDSVGKPLVIGFWSPAVPESVRLLATLERVHQQVASQGVQVIGVCIANDRTTGARFAREQGCSYPVVTDDGTHWAEDLKAASPLAEAYDLGGLPAVYIADRHRNLLSGVGQYSAGSADTIIQALQRVPPLE